MSAVGVVIFFVLIFNSDLRLRGRERKGQILFLKTQTPLCAGFHDTGRQPKVYKVNPGIM